MESPPMKIDYDAEHDLMIAWGSLLAADDPDRGRLRVTLGGVIAIDAAQTFHPTEPKDVKIGVNRIGLSTSVSVFTGEISSITAH